MSIRKLFVVLLFIAVSAVAMREVYDPDLWWHMRTGEVVLTQGIPHTDPGFSFTFDGREWVAHEWLSDVILYLVYEAGGLYLLSFVFAVFVVAAYGLLYLCSPGRPYLAGFVMLWGFAASLPFIGVRPQVFNILLGAAFVFLVERVRDGKLSGRWLWLIPPLTVLWANLHSGFLLGSAILGVYVVGGALQRRLGTADERTLSWAQIKLLAAMAAIAFLAAAINPNTYQLWIYPFLTLGSPAMQAVIAEWQSPNFHVRAFWVFGSMVLGGLTIMIFSGRRPTWTDMLFFLGTGAAGLQSVRHIPLFTVVTIPIITRHLLYLLRGSAAYPMLSGEGAEGALSPMLRRVNVGLAVVGLLTAAVWTSQRLATTAEIMETEFPIAAVDFLEQSGRADGRILNDYEWGGYLIWRGVPAFIDGRADVYGDDFIFYYLQAYLGQEKWEEPLEEYNVDYVLTRPQSNLAALLRLSDEWDIIYQDDVALVFGRTNS